MVITYEGTEFIKIVHGDLTVALNPVSKKSKLKGSSFGADIALISVNHPDMNGADAVTRKDKEPFVISGPGEYEVNNLFIKGFASKSEYDGKEMVNTIYTFDIDGIRVVFLGAIVDKDLSGVVKEALDNVDVLFVPIGGEGVLDAAGAFKIAVKRESSVIIPIHYGSVGDKGALNDFLKEGGAEGIKAVEKITLKRKDLESKNGEIVVLKPLN
ncbi:MAG: hypothetical protein ACI9GH_000587 [Candidatus Paceibacteria bacterium]|jgi:hypothetical protein